MTLSVVIVNDSAHVNGGAAQVALSSAVALAQRGHRTFLLAATLPVDEALAAAGVEVVTTGQYAIADDPDRARAVRQGLWNWQAARAIDDLLKRCDPASTVVHVHGFVMALSSSVVRAAKARGFKVVLTLHDYFIACPNGGFFNYPRQQICHLKPLSPACVATHCDSRSYPQKLWRVARQLVQRGPGRVPADIDAFVTVSDFSRRVLASYLPSTARVFAIDNPLDVPRQPAARIHEGAPFAFVGRIASHKGVTLLAEAHRGLQAPLLYVGDGPQRQQVERIAPDACITGWLGRAEVHERLRHARAVVLPSLWYETQGLVVAEAAAMGIPAIVADTCAARDMVSPGETGLWFSGGDVGALSRQMRVLQNIETARQFGAAAYETYWQSNLTMPRHVVGLETCYAALLAPAEEAV